MTAVRPLLIFDSGVGGLSVVAYAERFVREQGVRVTHPHVVAPRSWAAEDQLALISMDLVRGGSVDDLRATLFAMDPEGSSGAGVTSPRAAKLRSNSA